MRTAASNRWKAAIGVALVHLAVGAGLLLGLAGRAPAPPAPALTLVDLAAPPPPPPVLPPRPRPKRADRPAAGTPPNRRARATEIVAPPPVPKAPLPVIAAPVPALGNQAAQGDADTPGPGTGAGGFGGGPGDGGGGDGDGGTPPRQVGGRMGIGDLPRALIAARIGGTVHVRYHVEVDGRATACRVTRSSGDATLDALTCRLIEERFRFRPARDEAGRKIASTIVEHHEWIVDPADAERDGDPR